MRQRVQQRGFFEHHPCVTRRCVACNQKHCREYLAILPGDGKPPQPTQVPCPNCGRSFYGPHCHENHRVFSPNAQGAETPDHAICVYLRKCKKCCKSLDWWTNRHKRQRPHKCQAYVCKTCKDVVEVGTHQCYMQPVRDPDSEEEDGGPPPAKRPRRSAPRRTAHAVRFLSANDNEASDEEEEEETRPTVPPYFVYADYECTQDDQLHVPILICAKGEDHGNTFPALVFYGQTCTEQFYYWLLTKTEVLDDPRK